MNPSFIPYRMAGAYIAKRLREEGIENPEVGIICGSGLSELSEALEGKKLTVRLSRLTFVHVCRSSCVSQTLCSALFVLPDLSQS